MTTKITDELHCEWFDNPNKQWLEKAWSDLEGRSDCSFFLSWVWIGTWLDCIDGDFTVIEARKNGLTVGLGILSKKQSPFIGSLANKYFLHRTGVEQEDQIWIEYNDFLLSRDEPDDIRNDMLAFIADHMRSMDSIVIGVSVHNKFKYFSKLGVAARTIWEAPTYRINFLNVGSTGECFLATLSRNARYQIRRSIKKYQQIGEISIQTAKTVTEANSAFELAGVYHRKRWQNSGFDNEVFMAFHSKLIEKGMALGVVELNVINAGTELVAVVYNFKYRGVIYFYLSAINYAYNGAHYKPGMLAHYYLIDKFIKEGAQVYDFLGGKARYKETFSNQSEMLSTCEYQKESLLLSAKQKLRNLKYRLNGQ